MSYTAMRATGLAGAGVEARQRRNRFALGAAVSLAMHALLLSAWQARGPGTHDDIRQPREISVWLRPAPPALPHPEQPAREPKERLQAKSAPNKERRTIAIPDSDRSTAQEAFVVQQGEAGPLGPASQPHFDRDAALKLARQIASEEAVGRPLTRKAYGAETTLARGIAQAKRRDCKDGLPGGLLGPVIILFDKKDHGCKW